MIVSTSDRATTIYLSSSTSHVSFPHLLGDPGDDDDAVKKMDDDT